MMVTLLRHVLASFVVKSFLETCGGNSHPASGGNMYEPFIVQQCTKRKRSAVHTKKACKGKKKRKLEVKRRFLTIRKDKQSIDWYINALNEFLKHIHKSLMEHNHQHYIEGRIVYSFQFEKNSLEN